MRTKNKENIPSGKLNHQIKRSSGFSAQHLAIKPEKVSPLKRMSGILQSKNHNLPVLENRYEEEEFPLRKQSDCMSTIEMLKKQKEMLEA